jgi:hypothetical protein
VYTPVAVNSPPAWARPPGNVLPGVVPLEVIVARTDQTVVAVSGMRAYPTGFGFTLHLRLRDLSPREEQQFASMFADVPEGEPLPDGFLRFGVQFADGRKAINLGPRPISDGGEPEAPVLEQVGVSGVGSSVWDAEQWVWPLPPPGPFAFVCDWPGRGIALSRVEIDAGLILQAAE